MEKKRLERDDRINLQAGIAKGLTLAEIAKILRKARPAVFREIVNNCTCRDCRHTCARCKRGCGAPQKGLEIRPRPMQGPRRQRMRALEEVPYVCNGCPEARLCSDRKRYYDCAEAEESSQRSRREPRTFKGISEAGLKEMDPIVTAGVRNGQSIRHIHASSQTLQGMCYERSHEFVRYVIPKGFSLDSLTQRKVGLLFSHINSYVRGSNQNKTPYDLMAGRFGAEFMEIIGIKRVKAADVCLKPSLLK